MAARPRKPGMAAALPIAALLLAGHTADAQTDRNGPADSPAVVLPDRLLTGSHREDAPIDIKFVTAPDTAVDLNSLRIWVHKAFGWVDVTNRLRAHPQVSVNKGGIHLNGGVLPPGDHQVRLLLQDMKGRGLDTTETLHIARVSSSS